jgi:cytochrome c-type biogenesis protein CcmE
MKLVVGMVVVALALGFFIFTTFTSQKSNAFLYYYTVGEALAAPEKIGDTAVRIGGKVVPGTIRRDAQARRVTFIMADDKEAERQIQVAYHSSITPDTFKDESEVLVEGKFRTDGTFEADTLFAKCPSKYESKGYPESGPGDPPEPTD